jgi:hypothetical protein
VSFFPFPPRDPPIRVRTIDRDQDRPLILGIIRPHAMNRITAERLPIDEATRVGFVRWIILEDFAMQHGEKDFIKRQLISRGFFIGMIADADPIGAYCFDYIVNVDVRLSLSILKQLRHRVGQGPYDPFPP